MATLHDRPEPRLTPRQTIAAKRLTGSRCRCGACGEFFNSVSVFDAHRAGSWADRGAHRHCLTAEQLIARGYRLSPLGFWIRGPSRKSHAHGARPGFERRSLFTEPPRPQTGRSAP
jgi:hypothetical protein